jgi:replicative DNA helicase
MPAQDRPLRNYIGRASRQRPLQQAPYYLVGEIDGAIVRPSNRYSGARVNEVGEISAALKGLAKDLDVPVLALAQLSRQVETRDERRPTMANLRD